MARATFESYNIYVCHNDQKITIDNVYSKYKTRAGLLKSKKFYSNEFGTNVKYDYLMDLKKELMKSSSLTATHG